MDTELCTLRSRFINVYDTDELKSKLQDILPFDKKGYKTWLSEKDLHYYYAKILTTKMHVFLKAMKT